MQLNSAPTPMLASQTINVFTRVLPTGGVTMRSTEREFRIAGAREGIDTYTSAADAIAAARVLSRGSMPGLAVVEWRGGYKLHDVHTRSRTWTTITPHHPSSPPNTTLTASSSVPFAAGNLRMGTDTDARFNPAVVRDDSLIALVDGNRTFITGTDTWAGKQLLVELGGTQG